MASQTEIIWMPSIMLLQILATWPLPAAPAWMTDLPIAARTGGAALECGLGAADHEGQARRLGAGDAAGNRRVQHGEAARRCRRRHGARGIDVDGRAVDQQRRWLARAAKTPPWSM